MFSKGKARERKKGGKPGVQRRNTEVVVGGGNGRQERSYGNAWGHHGASGNRGMLAERSASFLIMHETKRLG